MRIFPISVCENKLLNYGYAWENDAIMSLILMTRVGF